MMDQKQSEGVEEQILAFTAKLLGTKKDDLSWNSRLLQDLGMDGDDAVEFFKQFGQKFNVNLEDLYAHWHKYFSPEGSPIIFFGMLLVLLMCIAAGFLLRDRLGILPSWGWGVALVGLVFVSYRRWLAWHPKSPIALRDLIESARSGCWTKSPDAR